MKKSEQMAHCSPWQHKNRQRQQKSQHNMGKYKQMYKTKGTDNQLIERTNRNIEKISKITPKQLNNKQIISKQKSK